jgi:zinc protease
LYLQYKYGQEFRNKNYFIGTIMNLTMHKSSITLILKYAAFPQALFLLLAVLLVPYSYGETSDTSCLSTQWPHDFSELAPDPSVQFGKLPNGFRYVIKHNETPSDRVAMYLNVQAGSIHERDNEKGYAHYLEHMLFNGTTHFPPGKLVEYFQDIGMNFGADTNAYTTFEDTVYTIVLPQSDVEEIEKGFLVMSDYAQGALLLADEVNRERGVILSEKLARDSVEYRMQVARNINALQGTLLAERQPIGSEKTINDADSLGLRAFYDRWYRPDNMILIVVGDIEITTVEELIQKNFHSLAPRSAKPQCPDIGELSKRGVQSFYYHEPQAGRTQVTLGSYWQVHPRNDSFELQIELLQDYMATSILQKRLDKIAGEEVGLMSAPHVYTGDLVDTIRYSGVTASTTKERWQEVLALLETVLRQAIVYGVTEQELEHAKKDVQAYLEERVSTEDSRRSTQLVREILYAINNNRVFQSPQQEKTAFGPSVSFTTIADIQRSLRNLFDRQDKLIEVTGNALINDASPEQLLLAVYNESSNQPLQAYSKERKPTFPYIYPATQAAQPLRYEEHEDIDVHSFVYPNNTVLNFKKSDYEKNQLHVQIRFGPGQRGEPSPGMAMIAEGVVDGSGTATLTDSQLGEVLGGSSVSNTFGIDTSRFYLRGKSLTADVEQLFDTLYALLQDPGIREEVYLNTMTKIKQMYQGMVNDVRGSEVLEVKPFMAGGNHLFGMVPLADVEKIRLSQINKWVLSVFESAQLEISVVGDVEKDTIVELVGKYFGTRPPGKKIEYDKESVVFPRGEKKKFYIDSPLEKTLLAIAWETQGFNDITMVRRLNLLADVFEERIRLAIRERLGASYSPDVYHSASRVIPEHGMVYVRIITDIEQVEEVEKVVRSLSADLASSGVTEEELMRVKNPTLTSLKDMLKTNSYWQNTVLTDATLYPEQLQWPTTIIDDYTSITAAELSSLAKRYLKPADAATALVSPNKDTKN